MRHLLYFLLYIFLMFLLIHNHLLFLKKHRNVSDEEISLSEINTKWLDKILNEYKFNDIDLITKVIDGKFPDYSRVIPEGHNNVFNIDRVALLDSMLRASILSNDKYRGIRMAVEENNLKPLQFSYN